MVWLKEKGAQEMTQNPATYLKEMFSAMDMGLTGSDVAKENNFYMIYGGKIATYNERLAVIARFEYGGIPEFIAPTVLRNALLGISGENLQLDLKPDGSLHIKGRGARGCIIKQASATHDDFEKSIKKMMSSRLTFFKIPSDFMRGLELCSISVETTLQQSILSNIALTGRHFFSSDDLRISRFKLKEPFPHKILLPVGGIINNLLKCDVKHYAISADKVWFILKDSNDITYWIRIASGEFPVVNHYFKVEGLQFTFPEGMEEVVSATASILAEVQAIDNHIDIRMEKGKIICRGETGEGWLERSIDANYKGKETSFLINPKFFLTILDHTHDIIIGEERALFSLPDGDFDHVMALPVKS
jgi:hypothetical protein